MQSTWGIKIQTVWNFFMNKSLTNFLRKTEVNKSNCRVENRNKMRLVIAKVTAQ
jgi:hypothetical protein